MAWLKPPKTSRGAWTAYWWESTGKGKRRKRQKALSRNEALARKMLAELNGQLAQGAAGIARNVPLAQLRAEYVRLLRADAAAASYVSRVEIALGHVERLYPGIRTAAVTADLLDHYKAQRRGEGIEGSTLNRELGIIKTAARKGRRWQFQVQDLSDVGHIKVPEKAKSAYARRDIQAFLKAAKPEQRTGLFLGLYAGLRRGEILGLLWRDIDFDEDRLLLLKAKMGKVRALPLHPELRAYLWRLRKKVAANPEEHVLPWTKTPQHFTGQLSALRRKLGIDRGSWHRLRHTFVTELKKEDVDTAKAQRLVGHSSERTTQAYTHLEVRDLRGAIRKVKYG